MHRTSYFIIKRDWMRWHPKHLVWNSKNASIFVAVILRVKKKPNLSCFWTFLNRFSSNFNLKLIRLENGTHKIMYCKKSIVIFPYKISETFPIHFSMQALKSVGIYKIGKFANNWIFRIKQCNRDEFGEIATSLNGKLFPKKFSQINQS